MKKGVLNFIYTYIYIYIYIYIYRISLEQVKLIKALEKHPEVEGVINFTDVEVC